MRHPTRTARLLLLPLVASAALVAAGAAPALACPSQVGCATSGEDGRIGAATSYITISVRGGSYQSRTRAVSVPNRVPPPCYYTKGRTEAEMVELYNDPDFRHLAHGVGEPDYDALFPKDFRDREKDDGNWYSWECSSANFDGSTKEFIAYVDQWSRDNPGQVWVPAGQAPPQPPVPPEILVEIARQAMEDTVRMPTASFNPATRSYVRLETWMWFDPAAWEPVSVEASGGGNSVRVTATPRRVEVSGLPAGSTTETTCTGGGRPYAPGGGETDCSITFSRSSGSQPGQQWAFQVSMTWDVTVTGAALTGPPTITRSSDEALQVGEAQAVGSR
jgi:hypothetical protein